MLWFASPAAALAVALAALPPQDGLAGRIQALVRDRPGFVESGEIGQSREGRAIPYLRLGEPAAAREQRRAALLVVAGIDGRHAIGVEAALGLAEALAARRDLFQHADVYVVPRLNPDAFVRRAAGGPLQDFGGTLAPADDDEDGRVDEDAPLDLDGDGIVAQMRVANPPAGVERTHVIDADDPRLVRKADRTKGEVATHALLPEGLDRDGDGRFAEDPIGGVDLDRNFPYRWPEHEPGAGPFPLSEPESHALVEWMLARGEIAAVLVLGRGDTLVHVPESGKFDDTGEVPLGIENDDKPYHEEIARLFRELTGLTEGPKPEPKGSLFGWCYAYFGVPTFLTPVWDLSLAPKPEAPAPPEAPAAEPPSEAKTKEPEKDKKKRAGDDPSKEERAWLAEAARRGTGFAQWTLFQHPELGAVEIGGLWPGFECDAPESEVPARVEKLAAFAGELLQRLPRLRVAEPVVEALGAGAFRVSVRVVNDGYLPSISAIGVKARRLLPIVFRAEVDDAHLLSGSRVQRSDTVPGSGGEARAEWVVAGDPGAEIALTLRSALLGERSLSVLLQEGAR